MAIKGRDFVLEVEQNGVYRPICYATDCGINMDFEAKEISGSQGQWRDYIGGYAGYSLTVPALVMYLEDMNWLQLEVLAKARAKFRWRAGDQLPSGVIHAGIALITNLNLTAQFRDAVKFDMTAIGCGEKESQLVPFAGTVYLADGNKMRLAGCPNPYPVAIHWYSGDGNGMGGVIGVAFNNDDVVDLFNNHEENEHFEISVGTTGCDFNILVDWDAPFIPDVIFAQPSPEMGLSPNQNLNQLLSPDQTDDQGLSPYYS